MAIELLLKIIRKSKALKKSCFFSINRKERIPIVKAINTGRQPQIKDSNSTFYSFSVFGVLEKLNNPLTSYNELIQITINLKRIANPPNMRTKTKPIRLDFQYMLNIEIPALSFRNCLL